MQTILVGYLSQPAYSKRGFFAVEEEPSRSGQQFQGFYPEQKVEVATTQALANLASYGQL
jgi:hypothetical protein